MNVKITSMFAAAALAASFAHGAIIFSEDFESLTAGALDGQAGWSGNGGSNADYTVAANVDAWGFGGQSLFFEATSTTNTGQQRFFNDLSSLTGGVVPTGQDIYVGYAYRKVGDFSLIQVSDLLGATNDAGNYKWDTNDNEFNNVQQSGGSSPAADGTINYVAVRFVWDSVEMAWNNPSMWSTTDGTAPDLDGPATSTNPTTTGGYASWSDLYFNFGAAASVEAGDGYQIDKIMIATTATELETYLAAVPEPSAAGLLVGSLALGALGFRRRR